MGSAVVPINQTQPTKPVVTSVSSHHPDYDEAFPDWVKCRDTIKGERAVKDKGVEYLPQLSGQDAAEYKAYKDRALFYGAIKRTLKGMTGMVFRKAPVIEGMPENISQYLQDITFTGMPMYGFSKLVFWETLAMGRCGIWVDMPKKGSPEQRPYLVQYDAEQIINWRSQRINGKIVTTMIVLEELYEEPYATDPFVTYLYTQYRVLLLDKIAPESPEEEPPLEDTGEDATGKFVYKVQLYRQIEKTEPGGSEKKGGYYLFEETIPVRNGQPMDYIPFVVLGPEGCVLEMQDSPIQDMVDVVLSHYRSSADLENGRHWCGIPQPYLAGFPDKGEWKIGGSVIWQTTEPNAKAEFLEFQGKGLEELRMALSEKEDKMAVLGMRILETAKKASEKPEALKLRMLGDVSVLQAIARTVGQALTTALGWLVNWMSGDSSQLVVALNQDYDAEGMTSADLTALVTAWQTDAISYKTLYANLQKGEYTRDGVEADDELDDIRDEKEESDAFNAERGIVLPGQAGTDAGAGAGEDTGDEGDQGSAEAGDQGAA